MARCEVEEGCFRDICGMGTRAEDVVPNEMNQVCRARWLDFRIKVKGVKQKASVEMDDLEDSVAEDEYLPRNGAGCGDVMLR